MLLSTAVLASPPHSSSPSHPHPSPSSSSLMSSAASASTTRSVLRRYQHQITEQPPSAASHRHGASTQAASTHARPPVHPGHHTTASLPAQPGGIPSGLVRMRMSQYLAMCEASAPHDIDYGRPSTPSRLGSTSSPVSPRYVVSTPSSPRPSPLAHPHYHPHAGAAPVSPLPYPPPDARSVSAASHSLSTVSAIIAALHSHSQRPPVTSPLSAQQQLAVAGRVQSLAKAYTELARQQQLEKERERERSRQRSQRLAQKQNKRPLPSAHNSVLAAVPHSRISLRRRHSDPRSSPPSTMPRVVPRTANVAPPPARTHRTFPRSSLIRIAQPTTSATGISLSANPSRSQALIRLRFRRSCLVRQYSRCRAGSSGVPRNGGVSLGLDWSVVQQSSAKLRRDNGRAAAADDGSDDERTCRRYPSQNVNEELPRLSERERRDVLAAEDDEEAVRERMELDDIRMSRQSNFCNCKPVRRTREEELEAEDDDEDGRAQPQCCTDASCPCVRDGIGCHVEGNHYCQCNLSSSSSRPPSCGNPHGLFQFDEYSVRQHALDVLYPSYEPHSISRSSHSRDDSASSPSSMSPALSSPSSSQQRAGGYPGLRSASFSFHQPGGAPVSLLSSWSAAGGSGGGGWWDMSGGGGSGFHTPRAWLRRPSRVSPPSSPLFVHSGRSSTATVLQQHRATG